MDWHRECMQKRGGVRLGWAGYKPRRTRLAKGDRISATSDRAARRNDAKSDAESAVWSARVGPESRADGGGAGHADARDRRDHGDLYRGVRGADCALAVSAPGTTGDGVVQDKWRAQRDVGGRLSGVERAEQNFPADGGVHGKEFQSRDAGGTGAD